MSLLRSIHNNHVEKTERIRNHRYGNRIPDNNDVFFAVSLLDNKIPESLIQENGKTDQKFTRIAFPTLNAIDFIAPYEIVRCEADSNYTILFLNNGKHLLLSKTLKEIESKLPADLFIRTHHSHLINKDYIRQYVNRNGHFIILDDQSKIPVSQIGKERFLVEMKLK